MFCGLWVWHTVGHYLAGDPPSPRKPWREADQCLNMPDTEQKTRTQSDQPVLKFAEIQTWCFSSVFGHFLSTGWSDWVLVFCFVSGILRYKFWVPTKGTLKSKRFWPIKGVWTPFGGQIENKNRQLDINTWNFTQNLVILICLFFPYALMVMVIFVIYEKSIKCFWNMGGYLLTNVFLS